MVATDYLEVISVIGFPIIACISMARFMQTIIDSTLQQNKQFSASLERFNDTLIAIDIRLNNIESEIKK